MEDTAIYETFKIEDLKFQYQKFDNEDGSHFGYQREDARRRATKISEFFDPKLLDAPVVSRRSDGSLYVIDGQARTIALKDLGKDEVYCRVLDDLTLEDEVQVFIGLQDNRKNITPSQKYLAAASVKDSWADKADKLLRQYGLWTGAKSKAPEGSIVIKIGGLLDKLHKEMGDRFLTVLDESLKTLKEAYPQEQPFNSASIEGVARVIYEMGDAWTAKSFSFMKVLSQGNYHPDRKLDSFEKLEDLVHHNSNGSSGAKAGKYRELFSKASYQA